MTDEALTEQLHSARVAELFRVARPAYVATLANAAILVVLLWGAFPPALLAAWFGTVLAITTLRLAMHWGRRRWAAALPALEQERRFAIGALAAGATWAYAAAVFFPGSDPLLQMAVVFVVGGSIIGATGVYAPSPRAFYSFSTLPYLAVSGHLLLQPHPTYWLLGLMVIVFGAAMARVFNDVHAGIVYTLATRLKNEDLLAQVKAAEQRVQEANAGTATQVADLQQARRDYLAVLAEERTVEGALRTSEALYRSLVETSNDLIWSIDRDGRWTYLNAAAVRRIYGHEPEALYGTPLGALSAAEVRERDAAVFARVLQGEPVFDYETRHLRRDGNRVDLSFNAVPLRDAQGAVAGATGTARDVSAQKRAEAALHESVEKLRLAVDAADLVYWEWDAASDRVLWGRDPRVLFGDAAEEAQTWAGHARLVHPEDRERFAAAALATFERGEPYEAEYRVAAGPAVAWISARGIPALDHTGRARRMIGVSQDITGRKRREEEVRFLAYHDSLTSLPNRRLLDDRLAQALFLAERRDARIAVMLVDLDDFKQINDSHGHRAGDAVLREVAQRLSGCVRKADTLARHGGDEFAIVIPDLQQDSDCQVVSEKLLRALEPAFLVEGQPFRLGASIGISLYPADARDSDGLLRNADAAMYRAKQLGKNNFRFYGR